MKFFTNPPKEDGFYWLYGFKHWSSPTFVKIEFEMCSDNPPVETDPDAWREGRVYFLGSECSWDVETVTKHSEYWYGPVFAPER